MTLTATFDDLIIVEWGGRPAIQACGDLFAQLGATVLTFDQTGKPAALSRFKSRHSNTPEARATAFARANIVLMSSDRRNEPALPPTRPGQILVDITVDATGAHGHWTEPLLQAATGITDITGIANMPPVICDAPIIEFQTAIFAAAGILTAWPRLTATGNGQTITLSLIDCALNNLSSFLPLVFAGKAPRRSGNRHPMAVPWNSYRCSDGWLLLCSATDEHWVRLCGLMKRMDLSTGRFEKLVERVAHCEAVDAEVEAWTSTQSVKDCVAALNTVGLAAGAVLTLGELGLEPNLIHRGSISPGPLPAPLSFLKTGQAAPGRSENVSPGQIPALPLQGVRVVEIGQYTTAPLAAKQLALLGAEVIKIEPPGGEASRAWPPHQDGQGYFFTMNNANKRSCLLDLRNDADRETFARLLAQSDILIENMKPGSLHKLGFGHETLARLNSRLIYCGISGFGIKSAYPGRPAFDTVVQAMSGLMDVTRVQGAPVKLGISASDVTGGIAGLFAVMCGLEQRRRTGRGVMIDLSMQDVSVWVTQTLWNGGAAEAHTVATCSDGFVVAGCAPEQVASVAGAGALPSRSELVDRLGSAGIASSTARTLREIADDPGHGGGGAIQMKNDEDGRSWPLFKCPYLFSNETTSELVAIGALGEANGYVADLCDRQSDKA